MDVNKEFQRRNYFICTTLKIAKGESPSEVMKREVQLCVFISSPQDYNKFIAGTTISVKLVW
jgi:hypothetical protein